MYKKIILFGFITLALTMSVLSNSIEIDLKPQYTDDVWFSFASGVVKSEQNNNWDIAFQIGQKAGILINEPKGINLWLVPNSDEDSWTTTIDTVGMSGSWELLHNSNNTWDIGAFNCGKDGFENNGDFGWGRYDMGTHGISGNKVFIIKTADKKYRKVMIESLLSKKYFFKIADLDGNNERIDSVSKADYPNKNYIYYDISSNKIINREPDTKDWDLVFGKYIDLIPMQGGELVPYPVSGVRHNKNYRTAELNTDTPYEITAPSLTVDNYATSLVTIGSDWKTYDMAGGIYVVNSKKVFFCTKDTVGTENPTIHKIVFKTFEGSATGKLSFELNPKYASITDNQSEDLRIFPTQLDNNSILTVELDNINSTKGIEIYDALGNELINMSLQTGTNEIDLSDFMSGSYMVVVKINDLPHYFRKVIKL